MDSSANYPDLIKSGMKKKPATKKKYKGPVEGSVDPGFLRDMGYDSKKKKKGQ